jgi:hypothetical protein
MGIQGGPLFLFYSLQQPVVYLIGVDVFLNPPSGKDGKGFLKHSWCPVRLRGLKLIARVYQRI